ncbi:hypothetical protein BGZ63DRAFT_57720 [Mariannaea sp. PMI_226]|nr:hypothetical protein BGZ63DRAFT_57720 [Mariannaea sp. PMI_226]
MLLGYRRQANTPVNTMSTINKNDPVPSGDPSASAPAQTSDSVSPASTGDSVPSASDAQPTSQPPESQSSAAPSDPATESSSAVESSQPSETQASSDPPSSESSKPSATAQPSKTIPSSAPAKETSSADEPSSSDDQPSPSDDSSSKAPESTVVIVTKSSAQSSVVVVVTSTTINEPTDVETSAPASTSTSESPALGGGSGGNSDKGLSQGSKVAIGVVVPIAAIAILALIGLFWWKKRRSRKEAEEERRKEVEDYAYNPNADPTVPHVMGDGYEMREDTSSAGYRGWGSTTLNSTGRKASTTMSGGQTGQAYSDITSPTRGNASDGRSNDPLMDGSYSPEGEILGAMGPNAANNRGADVHRGPSNASSSYSAARSDGSDPIAPAYGAPYYDQYTQNTPYEAYNGQAPTAPVIRDNPARRNTRIENPSHYPQQSAGISQNF